MFLSSKEPENIKVVNPVSIFQSSVFRKIARSWRKMDEIIQNFQEYIPGSQQAR